MTFWNRLFAKREESKEEPLSLNLEMPLVARKGHSPAVASAARTPTTSDAVGSAASPGMNAGSGHILVVVSGTLFHANGAAMLLKDVVGESVAGVGAVFGMSGRLEVNTSGDKWVALSTLSGRWLLVVPEDAYARFRAELSGQIASGRLVEVDGRPGGTFVPFSKDTVSRIKEVLGA